MSAPFARSHSAAASASIIEVANMDDFSKLATASKRAPIILDFYADWCGPCKQLSPKLEQASLNSKGSFQIAKVDVESQELGPLVAHLKIQSLPTLMVLHDEKIVANSIIVGLPDDAKLAAYIKMVEGLGGQGAGTDGADGEDDVNTSERVSEYLAKLKDAKREAGDDGIVREAAQFFSRVVSAGHEGEDATATKSDVIRSKVGLAICALREGNVDIARDLARSAEGDCGENQKFGELEALKAQLEFFGEASDKSLDELEAKLSSNPGDLDLQCEYASSLFAEGQPAKAMEVALDVVKKDRNWNEEAGRKLLLRFFDALGPTDELTILYRKKLSNVWF